MNLVLDIGKNGFAINFTYSNQTLDAVKYYNKNKTQNDTFRFCVSFFSCNFCYDGKTEKLKYKNIILF